MSFWTCAQILEESISQVRKAPTTSWALKRWQSGIPKTNNAATHESFGAETKTYESHGADNKRYPSVEFTSRSLKWICLHVPVVSVGASIEQPLGRQKSFPSFLECALAWLGLHGFNVLLLHSKRQTIQLKPKGATFLLRTLYGVRKEAVLFAPGTNDRGDFALGDFAATLKLSQALANELASPTQIDCGKLCRRRELAMHAFAKPLGFRVFWASNQLRTS